MTNLTKDNTGLALILVSIFIVVLLLTAVGIINYVTNTNTASSILSERLYAAYTAEAGVAKAIFCLNHDIDADCGGTAGSSYPGENNVPFGNGVFTTTVTVDGSERIIISDGNIGTVTTSTLRVRATTQADATNASFAFGAYIGDGGLSMGNNALVTGTGGAVGNVFSHGTISCDSGAAISGTAQVAGSGNQIDGCDIGYDGSGNIINDEADAWAHTLKNCRVAHDIYHPTSGNISSCAYGLGLLGGTLYDNADLPDSVPFPITSTMILGWEAQALAGGIIVGPYSPSDNEIIGPIKIIGDLEITNGKTIYINGFVWVEGNIMLENNTLVQLTSEYGPNSSVIIADDPLDTTGKGKIELSNNATVEGSGDPDSYLMLVSTNTTASAILLDNNSSGSIYVATDGTVDISNNAELKEVIAHRVTMGNNAILIYETGLTSINFTNGPGGSWKVKRQTWQRL